MNPSQIKDQLTYDMLNNGFLYIHKRDRGLRPVLVMNINVLKSMKGTLDELTIANNFLSMYAIERVACPGKAEAWTTIIDLDGVGLSEIPIKNLKGIISAC
jgi:hypothetical protein